MPKKRPPKIYGVLGYPLAHSLSPAMHNAAFRALRLNARYEKFEVDKRELGAFLRGLRKNGISGLNVTIPYKEEVLPFLSLYRSRAVELLGAANTILVSPRGGLKGYNTDCLGFARHIAELKLSARKAAVIGAGGAAKAICFVLARKGCQEIAVYDLYRFKAISLVQRFQAEFPSCRFSFSDSIDNLRLAQKDLLVNASPVGMKQDDPLLVPPDLLSPRIFVYDVIYNPAQTKLLQAARASGAPCANGLDMLLYQGVESFNIWIRSRKAPVELMRRALARALARQR